MCYKPSCIVCFLVSMPECFSVSLSVLLCHLTDAALTATYIWAVIAYIRMLGHMVLKLNLEHYKKDMRK